MEFYFPWDFQGKQSAAEVERVHANTHIKQRLGSCLQGQLLMFL